MKKNWAQILSLVFNAVLLVMVFQQREALAQLDMRLTDTRSRLSDVHQSVWEVYKDVTNTVEEAGKLVTEYTLNPVGVDLENHVLEAAITLDLKTWGDDCTVAVKTVTDANTTVTVLSADAMGSCQGQLRIPLEEQGGIKMEAAVTNGGITTREMLASWDNISRLLPCQILDWDGVGYSYMDSQMFLDTQQMVRIGGTDGEARRVEDPVFKLYRNGEVAAEQTGTYTEDGYYRAEGWPEGISCGPGDTILLTFSCVDDYGLTYEFTYARWIVSEDGPLETWEEEDNYPSLIWQ